MTCCSENGSEKERGKKKASKPWLIVKKKVIVLVRLVQRSRKAIKLWKSISQYKRKHQLQCQQERVEKNPVVGVAESPRRSQRLKEKMSIESLQGPLPPSIATVKKRDDPLYTARENRIRLKRIQSERKEESYRAAGNAKIKELMREKKLK